MFYFVDPYFSLVGCYAQLNRTKIEKTLIKALFKDYDAEGRPVLNLSKPVLVKFGMAYSNLHSLVCINQVIQALFFRFFFHLPYL